MKKKVIVVCGVGACNSTEYTYDFCKVFKSEKKADKYYDKKYINLLELYTNKKIDYYHINYEFLDVK